MRIKKRFVLSIVVTATFLAGFILVSDTHAVPTFARKYKTSCSTCHYAFPRLNKFGRAFANNGLRYPGDDKDYAKEEAVSLGSEGYKKVFPNAIWPSDIPGPTTISFLWVSHTMYEPDNTGHEITFQNPNAIKAFTTGTMGDHLSFFFELEWEDAGEFGYGGFLDYRFNPHIHARLGNIEDFLPFHDHHALTATGFNYGDFGELDNSGIELWGAANGPQDRGGARYFIGVLNGQNDGEENVDLNSQKDVFAKFSYKIGGMGVLGSTEASESSAYWRDNSVTVGGFAHMGTMADYTRGRDLGGRVDLFYQDLNIFGVLMTSGEKEPEASDWSSVTKGFAEADYVVYPWFIPMARVQITKPEGESSTKEFVPGIVILARANVKVVPSALIDLNGNKENNRYDLVVATGF